MHAKMSAMRSHVDRELRLFWMALGRTPLEDRNVNVSLMHHVVAESASSCFWIAFVVRVGWFFVVAGAPACTIGCCAPSVLYQDH
jgi:hypothetical protein